MKRIIYTRPDGGISIVNPAPNARHRDETEADFLARLRLAIPKDATDIHICDDSEIPRDRTFRDAWVCDTSRSKAIIKTDIAEARKVQAARIKKACRAKAKDIIERETLGEDTTTEKTSLRAIDARALVDAAKTIEELKAAWPKGL